MNHHWVILAIMAPWSLLHYCWVINGSYANKGSDEDDCIDFLMGKNHSYVRWHWQIQICITPEYKSRFAYLGKMENKMDLKKLKENNTTFLELWNNFKGSCTMHGVGHMSFTLRFRWYVNIFLNLILFKIEKNRKILKLCMLY